MVNDGGGWAMAVLITGQWARQPHVGSWVYIIGKWTSQSISYSAFVLNQLKPVSTDSAIQSKSVSTASDSATSDLKGSYLARQGHH